MSSRGGAGHVGNGREAPSEVNTVSRRGNARVQRHRAGRTAPTADVVPVRWLGRPARSTFSTMRSVARRPPFHSVQPKEDPMPTGEKHLHSKKQHRHARHAREGSEGEGIGRSESNRRAQATLDREVGRIRKMGNHLRRQTGFE